MINLYKLWKELRLNKTLLLNLLKEKNQCNQSNIYNQLKQEQGK